MISAQAELGPFETYFVRLADSEPGLLIALGAIAVAGVVGAAHALAPGHAKAISAAYLVSSRGRPRDAVALGGIVAAMHTGSVLALGLILYAAMEGPGQATEWMTLASGALILAVGVFLITHEVRRRRTGHAHHGHHLLPEGVSPFSTRGLVVIGAAGGLLPSPSAFLVLATALFLDRLLYGLALVAAFSVGLATTVTLVGLLALRGRDVLAARTDSRPRLASVTAQVPLIAAIVVVAGGVYLTATAALGL